MDEGKVIGSITLNSFYEKKIHHRIAALLLNCAWLWAVEEKNSHHSAWAIQSYILQQNKGQQSVEHGPRYSSFSQ